jgi:hypothetical protein
MSTVHLVLSRMIYNLRLIAAIDTFQLSSIQAFYFLQFFARKLYQVVTCEYQLAQPSL